MICKEILDYALVKETWGLGPICSKVYRCEHCTSYTLGKIPPASNCFKCVLHVRIYGVYSDLNNIKRGVVFLGNDMSGALQRVNHVKSFL